MSIFVGSGYSYRRCKCGNESPKIYGPNDGQTDLDDRLRQLSWWVSYSNTIDCECPACREMEHIYPHGIVQQARG
jgi:hypothetical protein